MWPNLNQWLGHVLCISYKSCPKSVQNYLFKILIFFAMAPYYYKGTRILHDHSIIQHIYLYHTFILSKFLANLCEYKIGPK